MAVSALNSGNRHKRRQAAAPVAPIGAGRWRQSALGGGANRRWAVAPIGAGRWRQWTTLNVRFGLSTRKSYGDHRLELTVANGFENHLFFNHLSGATGSDLFDAISSEPFPTTVADKRRLANTLIVNLKDIELSVCMVYAQS
eukprot:COSAG02_NODE_3858_length_6134_cov_6.287016_2_plen_142_part_00